MSDRGIPFVNLVKNERVTSYRY